MSSTNRGGRRLKDDFYETQDKDILPIVRTLWFEPPDWLKPLNPDLRILDPGCGAGAFGRVIRSEVSKLYARGKVHARPVIDGVELDADRADEARLHYSHVFTADFLDWKLDGERYDLAIGNPPFSLAIQFAEKCFEVSTETCLLLPVGFVCSQKRRGWFKEHPPDLFPLSRRPSFAQSVKCVGEVGVMPACGWQVVLSLRIAPPKRCPTCGGRIRVSRSDSNEYGYFLWGPGHGGRWAYAGGDGSDVAADEEAAE